MSGMSLYGELNSNIRCIEMTQKILDAMAQNS